MTYVQKPFLPSDIVREGAAPPHLTRSISRALAAISLAALTKQKPESVLADSWANDHLASMIIRAAASPTTMTTGSALAGSRVHFLSGIAPASAAVKLFDRCLRLDMEGASTITIPSASTSPVPAFVGEGLPMPIGKGSIVAATLGPTRKMLIGSALTRELEYLLPDSASAIISRVLNEQAAVSLDAAAFDAAAADTVRPAGLLNGVTPITASTNTSTVGAMAEDIGNIAAALTTAKCSAEGMLLFCAPRQAVTLRMWAGPRFLTPIISVGALANRTVVGIDPNAIGAGYSGLPEIEVAKESALHFEDSSPLPISTVATPNTIAAPVRSLWQEDLLALKLRTRICWQTLLSGAVQVVTSTNW